MIAVHQQAMRFVPKRFVAIWVATGLLFALSPLVTAGSVGGSALLGSTLPNASILALAAIGQTLVIQQRGLDLSAWGMISLTAVIVTTFPNGNADRLLGAFGLVVLACVVSGLVSGIAVTRFGITPFVATLGVNALLLATMYQITNGTSVGYATDGLARFAIHNVFWDKLPNTVIVSGIAVLIVAAMIRFTVAGRRFVAVGASPAAARAAGIRGRGYELGTYVVASLAYGGAGILLSGFVKNPVVDSGHSYLLPTIAAVVLGGTALTGGSGSVVATAVGALFLTQLELVVDGLGAGEYWHLIIQGSIIALGMGLRSVPWRRVRATVARMREGLGKGLPGAPLPAGRTELPEGSDQ